MPVAWGNIPFTSEPITFSQVITDTDISALLLQRTCVGEWISEYEEMELLSISIICLASHFKVMIRSKVVVFWTRKRIMSYVEY